MKPERLLQHFDQLAEAPDAVPRLRRFILDLAVRGKLVEQDPADEPASELLKRIEAEKVRLTKAGEIRRAAQTGSVEDDNVPFRVPLKWSWARLGHVFEYDAGIKTQPGQLPGDAWLLELEDIEKDSGRVIQRFTVRDRSPQSTKSGFQKGDVLYGKLRPYLNKALVADDSGYSTTEIVAVRCYGESVPRYTCLALRRPDFVDYVSRLGQGTKMPRLRTEDALSAMIPIPPLAEQHRIVAKVDELMALCEELDAAQAKRERRRGRLVAATLHGLNNGDDSADPSARPTFQDSARFYFNHLPRLTTRPEHIHQLRQTILNLAVRGRLVPQDPKDESATNLLREIARERMRLLQVKGMREQKPAEPSEHLEDDAAIPDCWRYCYLQDIAYQVTDGTHQTPKYAEYGRPFLSAQNIKPFRFMPEKHRYVSEGDFQSYRTNRKPERGDVLLTRVGAGIGEAAVLDSDMEFAFYVSVCLIKIPTRYFLPGFLAIWLNSSTGRGYSTTRTYGKGFSQGNLNLGLIRTFRVPVPPLAEQHRIVTKVYELMSLCDELEARLTTTVATRRQILESTLREALEGQEHQHAS